MIHPLKDPYITQKFGNDLIQDGIHVYARYGWKGHNGIDYRARTPQPVYAPNDGYAEMKNDPKGYGVMINLWWDDNRIILGHLSRHIGLSRNVKQGELIGYTGNTGFSLAPHLHMDWRKVDKNRQTLNKGNGYGGCLDPLPEIEKTLASKTILAMTNYLDILTQERAKPENKGIAPIFTSFEGDQPLDEKNAKALIEIAALRILQRVSLK